MLWRFKENIFWFFAQQLNKMEDKIQTMSGQKSNFDFALVDNTCYSGNKENKKRDINKSAQGHQFALY